MGRARHALGDFHDHFARAYDVGGENGSVKHEVGQPREQQTVLVARWLGLRSVDNYRAVSVPSLGDGAQLPGGRKVGPAPAPEPAALDDSDQVGRRVSRHRAMDALVIGVPRGGTTGIDSGQETRQAHQDAPLGCA